MYKIEYNNTIPGYKYLIFRVYGINYYVHNDV